MPSYLNRKGRITAIIRRKNNEGRRINMVKTFATMEEAVIWTDAVSKLVDKHHSPIGPEDTLPIEITTLTRYDADKGATGVYFLFRNGECVYVGQSENVHVRVREHRLTKNNQKKFDSYAFLPVVPERLSEVEYHYIALLSPKLNSLGRPDLKVERKLRRLMPKDQRQVVQAQLAELRSNIGDTRLLASI